jgi:hypothetical protein
MMELILTETGRAAPGPLPFAIASLIGSLGDLQAGIIPWAPPLTSDQVEMLKTDNVAERRPAGPGRGWRHPDRRRGDGADLPLPLPQGRPVRRPRRARSRSPTLFPCGRRCQSLRVAEGLHDRNAATADRGVVPRLTRREHLSRKGRGNRNAAGTAPPADRRSATRRTGRSRACRRSPAWQLDHHQARQERHDEADADDARCGLVVQGVAVLVDVEREGAGHGRDGQEEAELGRGPASRPQQHRADDGRARARNAGDQRQALEQADDQRPCAAAGPWRRDRRPAAPSVDDQQDDPPTISDQQIISGLSNRTS